MTVTAPESTDISLERLRVAQDALKGIDLRTLPRTGNARQEVKDARAAIHAAMVELDGL